MSENTLGSALRRLGYSGEQMTEYRAAETTKLEREVFAQSKRLADAERTLAVNPTKAATESKRIAAD